MLPPVSVLAGGPSSEHEVSLHTSATLLDLARALGHQARGVVIDRQGGWHLGKPAQSLQEAAQEPPLQVDEALGRLAREGHVALLGLHGPFGEDGQVQRLLEAAGVPYTGSGPEASELGMDKELSKLAASKVGARCARHEVLAGTRLPLWGITKGLGYPCVVKPVGAGSSVGVSRVEAEDQVEAAVQKAKQADPKGRCMVEEWIEGLELAASVVRREGQVICLPLVAIEPAAAFYDYHAKYESEQTRYHCPADVPAEAADEVARVSATLYERLGLRGVVRVDFLLRSRDGRPLFLELNTLPGFTDHSLVPMSARAAGWQDRDVVAAMLGDLSNAAP